MLCCCIIASLCSIKGQSHHVHCIPCFVTQVRNISLLTVSYRIWFCRVYCSKPSIGRSITIYLCYRHSKCSISHCSKQMLNVIMTMCLSFWWNVSRILLFGCLGVSYVGRVVLANKITASHVALTAVKILSASSDTIPYRARSSSTARVRLNYLSVRAVFKEISVSPLGWPRTYCVRRQTLPTAG